MEPARTFQDLVVWQRAHAFVLAVYRVTKSFPREELYGLIAQFRRAAVSIAANIAEGFKKRGRADKVRYLNIAEGSLEECRYYCILAFDLGYLTANETQLLLEETSRLLTSYAAVIRRSS